MIVYLVAIWLGTCGTFSNTACAQSDIIGQFWTLKECRAAASAMRRVDKLVAQPRAILCLESE